MAAANKQALRAQKILSSAILTVLFISLLFVCSLTVNRFTRLNTSVEYERSVFISQIAEQMKKNLLTSRKNHVLNIQDYAAVLTRTQPKTFEQVRSLFPRYAKDETSNLLFFLSSNCELYGIDGVKQWASLPYEAYFLDALTAEQTSNFIRIGMTQEFMVYSALLPHAIEIDGHKISAILFGWDSSEYRSSLSSKLFEAKSSSLLVGNDGSIAIYPEDEDSESYGYNIITYLRKQGMPEDDLDIISNMLHSTEDQTALCEVDNARWLFSVAHYNDYYNIFIMLPIQITSSGTYANLYELIISVAASLVILIVIVGILLLTAMLRQRVQREKELQTELLMKTAQTKNEFLAKMSHDIRTPLNGIIGMNHIALKQTPPECVQVISSLKKVNIAANYLLNILNDILDMSKIESGEHILSSTPFSLEKLRDDVEALVVTQAATKNLRFIIDMPQSPDCDYIGDTLRLKQILINLLSNSVKFTQSGSITFSIRIRPVTQEADEITFIVKDTGKGMSPEFMSQMFVPFAQENACIAAQYGGSGLGLSIVKSFVDLMGGTITVSSEPEKGSEFTVTLVLSKTKRTQQDAQGEPFTASYPGKRVLLCEDNDLNAEIAIAILEDYGLAVDRAENGKIGVERYAASAPGYYAIVFMDVRMPLMDGYEATRAIRALDRPDAQTTPICALSANAFSEDISLSLEAGMNNHLAKPLNIHLLTKVLEEYLGEGVQFK